MNTEIINSIKLISEHFNIEESVLREFLNKNKKDVTRNKTLQNKFIVPYCGVIYNDCCKAIVYNHGLYTQCVTKCEEEICKACKGLKYGRIEQRIKLKPGELLVLENGKKETDYKKIIKKHNYDISELKKYFEENNLIYNFDGIEKSIPVKKGRGRPRKITIDDNSPLYKVNRNDNVNVDNDELIKEETYTDEDDDEIEVQEITIDHVEYYLTKENVVLDKNEHTIIGIYKQGKIEKIKR